MCGIAGILNFDPAEHVDALRLLRMRDVLFHRGPDDHDIALSGQMGLAHCRLSIIDIAGGHQPMANTARNVWISYNGEVYNFRELRADLERRGCHFQTQSDTEVILQCYESYGDDCVEKLRGMFAFAIWDQPRRKLFLARDRLGIKPLYYACTDRELLFASEIKAILTAGPIRPQFNKAILAEFLATRFCAGNETFFVAIKKLQPGHTLTWTQAEGLIERRYWSLPAILDESEQTLQQRAVELRWRLESAIRSHLVSDVPVGLFLSGGIDSTGLAAIMAPMLKTPLQTFSVGYDYLDDQQNEDCNELVYARLAAASVSAMHHEISLSPQRFFSALPKLIWHEDEPIAFPSSIPLYFVSDLAARNQVKVVLSGEGADELFLGYNRYRVTAWNERFGRCYWATIPASQRIRLRHLVRRLPRSFGRYAERSFLALAPGARSLFYENFAVFPASLRHQLISGPVILNTRDPFAISLRYFDEAPAGLLERMAHADLQTYLVELLMKQDQMSMAASIESRVPFLDQDVVEFAAAMPGTYKLRGWQTKAVLREALRGDIPDVILKRKKMGFPTPVGRWLRETFAWQCQDLVCSPRTLARGLFNSDTLRRLVDEHMRGKANHSERLWLLMNLEIWQRIFIDGCNIASSVDCQPQTRRTGNRERAMA